MSNYPLFVFTAIDNNTPQVVPIILCYIYCNTVFVTLLRNVLYIPVNIDQDN